MPAPGVGAATKVLGKSPTKAEVLRYPLMRATRSTDCRPLRNNSEDLSKRMRRMADPGFSLKRDAYRVG